MIAIDTIAGLYAAGVPRLSKYFRSLSQEQIKMIEKRFAEVTMNFSHTFLFISLYMNDVLCLTICIEKKERE